MVLLLPVLLSGCAAWTLVDTHRQTIAGRYSVSPQIRWSQLAQNNMELWTVDGPALQALRFFRPVDDGEPLFSPPAGAGADDMPAFRSSMTPTEIQELVVHSIERSGAARVRASGIRPWLFGELQGFRFDLEFLNSTGLEMRGLLSGVVDDGQLLLIAYTGTRVYYFPKYLPAVEGVLESIDTSV